MGSGLEIGFSSGIVTSTLSYITTSSDISLIILNEILLTGICDSFTNTGP